MTLSSIFSLFGQGLIAGAFLSGIPWAVGYVLKGYRRITSMS